MRSPQKFTTARNNMSSFLPAPSGLSKLLPHLVPRLLHFIEAPRMRDILPDIHHLVVTAYQHKWGIHYIDAANRFNPQQIEEIAGGQGVEAVEVLRATELARPFQMFQAVSIVEKLHEILLGSSGNLVIATGLSGLFLSANAEGAQRMAESPVARLVHSAGILGQICLSGNIVLVVDSLGSADFYSPKVHLKVTSAGGKFGEILAHPFLSSARMQLSPSQRRSNPQLVIDDFF